jgi:malonate transporter
VSVSAALAPVAILIGLGFGLRLVGFLTPAGWAAVERLVYFALFPPLLFLELARADLAGQPVLAFGGTLLATQLLMAAGVAAARPRLGLPGPAYTSVLQCVVRWNSYVALAAAPALFGAAGGPLVAIAIAFMVPAANLISVTALARHGGGTRPGITATLRAILGNPLILACIAGSGVNASGLALPPLVSEPLSILSRATLALGLLAVGAGLTPRAALRRPLIVLGTTIAKLVAKPLLAIGIGTLMGLDPTVLGVAALACGVPTATSSYILARLLGGDAELMAGLITATTLGAMLTLPLVLALAR